MVDQSQYDRLVALVREAREELVQLYTSAARGERETGERFAAQGAVGRIDTHLAEMGLAITL